ncbi:C-type lectin domain family 4 member F-like isoform X2 [Petaurus breviceps papuanus]|uniref:C-type lectin domain family 4 member F-like isoform X2 n=1 Tax=Petaurus breviceps papuanus TaxID=3040969 RepID=UPI0036DBEE54
MDTENIYMNIHVRKPPPKSLEPKAQTQPVYKNLKILYAVLILFGLMLVASLTATIILWIVLTLVRKGWKLHGGNIYYFSSEKKSWEEAQQSCVSENSNLTSVTSEEEQAFLTQTITSSHWIGLTDKGREGIWHWVDGNHYNHSENERFWRANQPDNWDEGKGSTEDCVHLLPGNLKSWNDANCKLSQQWICKISL